MDFNSLEKAEKLKEMREEADTLTEDFLKAVFLEMFGNPVTNSKKWEVKKMKDISKKIVNGTTPQGGEKVYVEKGIVFFRSQNVWKNRLSLDDVAHIDDDTHAKMIKSSLKNKDILMTKTGRVNTENSSLGRAAMFLGEDNSANINGHVYLIRLQENIIPEFVLFIITTNEYREYIRSVCVGAIDKRQINKEHLQNFPIIFPPVELQNKFVSIVKEIESMKEKQKQSRMQIHNLFDNLMQKIFKGELVC
jgi:restriction endonuclease S subunit